jgi:hypothetical protein
VIFDVINGFKVIGIDLRSRFKLKLSDAFVAPPSLIGASLLLRRTSTSGS